MRISDWSSDVCSSDLLGHRLGRLVGLHRGARGEHLRAAPAADAAAGAIGPALLLAQRHVQARGKGSAQHRVEGFARDAVALLAPRRHPRSEELRVGKEWVSTCSSRWSPCQYKKN